MSITLDKKSTVSTYGSNNRNLHSGQSFPLAALASLQHA
jgi:hypothetical protein